MSNQSTSTMTSRQWFENRLSIPTLSGKEGELLPPIGAYAHQHYPSLATKDIGQTWTMQSASNSIRGLIYGLKNTYDSNNFDTVAAFLEKHPFLILFLKEAYCEIQRVFGSQIKVMLEIVHDPEIPHTSELIGYISSQLAAEDAVDKLVQLDAEWFLDQSHQVRRKFNFNLKFN